MLFLLHTKRLKIYSQIILLIVYDLKSEDCVGYSGGVALNTVINSKIKKKIPNLVIPPHTNDVGISLGCVELLRQQYEQEPFDNTGFPFWQDDEDLHQMNQLMKPLEKSLKI